MLHIILNGLNITIELGLYIIAKLKKMFFFIITMKKNIYLFIIFYSSALCNSANSLTL